MLRSEKDIESLEARWAPAVAAGDLPTLTSILRDYAFPFGRLPRANAAPTVAPGSSFDAYAGTYRAAQRDVQITVLVQRGASPSSGPWSTVQRATSCR